MIIGNAIKTNGFRGFIDIYTTANATVTATTTGKAYGATANASGYARIKVGKKGVYNITSTGTTRIGHATVSNSTPVTAVYNWSKWNAVAVYSYRATSSGPLNDIVYAYQASSMGHSCSWKNGSFSFNTANGNFSIVNGSMNNNSGPFSGGTVWAIPNALSGNRMAVVNHTDAGKIIYAGVFIDSSGTWLTLSGGAGGGGSYINYACYQSYIASYNKGGTRYGSVSSTSLSAYPNNGRASDGYYYVAA